MRNVQDIEIPGHRYSVPMYIGAGGIATASHYALTIALVELFGVLPLAASTVGFALGATVKYWLNYAIAFRSRQSHSIVVPRFLVMLAIFFTLNGLFFALCHQVLGLHYVVAQVITTCLLIPPGYLLNRLWVFHGW